jgi:hypothetical protein
MAKRGRSFFQVWVDRRDAVLGAMDFYFRPGLRTSWGGPFNGQDARRLLFEEIFSGIRFGAIIETGTFRGTTTEYLHKTTGLPVYTVELQQRYYGYASARFAFRRRVHVYCEDSRMFLNRIVEQLDQLGNPNVFFYLDAHWGGQPPLRQELEAIFGRFESAVVMIDDFQVPHDPAYAYDVYSDGTALNLRHIADLASVTGIATFFPRAKAADETGLKRGCVVLARGPRFVDHLKEVKLLLPYVW